jgi:hypothetical protein
VLHRLPIHRRFTRDARVRDQPRPASPAQRYSCAFDPDGFLWRTRDRRRAVQSETAQLTEYVLPGLINLVATMGYYETVAMPFRLDGIG